MPLKLLTILVLLLPALRGGLLLQGDGVSENCPPTACCEVITTTTCCGLEMVQTVCATSGGECTCISDPTDLPKPSPTPVLPTTLGDLISEVSQTIEIVVWTTSQNHPPAHPPIYCQASTTHNQIQAALGVWRI